MESHGSRVPCRESVACLSLSLRLRLSGLCPSLARDREQETRTRTDKQGTRDNGAHGRRNSVEGGLASGAKTKKKPKNPKFLSAFVRPPGLAFGRCVLGSIRWDFKIRKHDMRVQLSAHTRDTHKQSIEGDGRGHAAAPDPSHSRVPLHPRR
jgi:hypothetical protein